MTANKQWKGYILDGVGVDMDSLSGQ